MRCCFETHFCPGRSGSFYTVWHSALLGSLITACHMPEGVCLLCRALERSGFELDAVDFEADSVLSLVPHPQLMLLI